MHSIINDTVKIEGDIKIDDKEPLCHMVNEVVSKYGHIKFDLTNAGYVNSNGMLVIALAVRKAPSNVRLIGTPSSIKRILGLTGLDRLVLMDN
jgi:anti-anti-sigma factor